MCVRHAYFLNYGFCSISLKHYISGTSLVNWRVPIAGEDHVPGSRELTVQSKVKNYKLNLIIKHKSDIFFFSCAQITQSKMPRVVRDCFVCRKRSPSAILSFIRDAEEYDYVVTAACRCQVQATTWNECGTQSHWIEQTISLCGVCNYQRRRICVQTVRRPLLRVHVHGVAKCIRQLKTNGDLFVGERCRRTERQQPPVLHTNRPTTIKQLIIN